jgi:AcrR family transcriptional regulator
MSRRTSAQTRAIILEACRQILRRDGMSHLTLEMVARQAGLSKGGLLYHYPTKESLVEALVEFHNDQFEHRLQTFLEKESGQPGAWLRAYALAAVEQIRDPENTNLYAGLFAAEEKFAGANELMRRRYVDWQQQVDASGLDPAWATLVRLTIDGLWFSQMHQYGPPDEAQRQAIVDMILAMTTHSGPIKDRTIGEN